MSVLVWLLLKQHFSKEIRLISNEYLFNHLSSLFSDVRKLYSFWCTCVYPKCESTFCK